MWSLTITPGEGGHYPQEVAAPIAQPRSDDRGAATMADMVVSNERFIASATHTPQPRVPS